jgi:hypothetical protein
MQVSCGWWHTVALTKPLGRLPLLPTPLGEFDRLSNSLIFRVLSFIDDAKDLLALSCCSSS